MHRRHRLSEMTAVVSKWGLVTAGFRAPPACSRRAADVAAPVKHRNLMRLAIAARALAIVTRKLKCAFIMAAELILRPK